MEIKISDFKHTQTRPDRSGIKTQWIEATVNSPDAQAIQTDGRIRKGRELQKLTIDIFEL